MTYLTSTKNIVGLSLAILGLVVHFAGAVGPLWPLVVVGLYAVGALAAPSSPRLPSVSPDTLDPDEVRRALSQCERKVSRGVPPDIAQSVLHITSGIRDLLGRVADQPAASEDVFILSRMATDYLPTTVDGFLRLPNAYAMQHKLADGRTPYEMVQGQLKLLDSKLQDVSDAMLKGDSDQLAAHGRFLEESFARSSLSLKTSRGES